MADTNQEQSPLDKAKELAKANLKFYSAFSDPQNLTLEKAGELVNSIKGFDYERQMNYGSDIAMAIKTIEIDPAQGYNELAEVLSKVQMSIGIEAVYPTLDKKLVEDPTKAYARVSMEARLFLQDILRELGSPVTMGKKGRR